jgi:hypothetical protein
VVPSRRGSRRPRGRCQFAGTQWTGPATGRTTSYDMGAAPARGVCRSRATERCSCLSRPGPRWSTTAGSPGCREAGE